LAKAQATFLKIEKLVLRVFALWHLTAHTAYPH